MGRIELAIGDFGNVLKLLGSVYKDPRDALAEFVTNSIDAKATVVEILLQRRTKRPYILISDNGYGMSKKELTRVAKNIGKSIKEADPNAVGEKGIGLLGFVNFGTRMKIISKEKLSRAYSLILDAGNPNATIEKSSKNSKGTDIYIESISTDKFRYLTPKRIGDYMRKKFRDPLLKEQFSLRIKEGKKSITVKPRQYKGEPFHIRKINTIYGNIKFSLYYIPPDIKMMSKVGICRKGILVEEDICSLPEFQHEPWIGNRLQGEITCDFIEILPTRAGFIRDGKKFPIFVSEVEKLEIKLKNFIKEKEKEFRKESDKKIYRILKKAFSRAISELEEVEPFKVRIASPSGSDISGKEVEMRGSGGVAGKRGKGGKNVIKKSKENKTKGITGRGFNWNERPFFEDQELRSQFDETFGTIDVNTIHSDYKAETRTTENKIKYFCKLTSKEVALWNYQETSPETLLEKMIELQILAERFI